MLRRTIKTLHFQFQDMSDSRSDRERKSSSLSRRISRYLPPAFEIETDPYSYAGTNAFASG